VCCACASVYDCVRGAARYAQGGGVPAHVLAATLAQPWCTGADSAAGGCVRGGVGTVNETCAAGASRRVFLCRLQRPWKPYLIVSRGFLWTPTPPPICLRAIFTRFLAAAYNSRAIWASCARFLRSRLCSAYNSYAQQPFCARIVRITPFFAYNSCATAGAAAGRTHP